MHRHVLGQSITFRFPLLRLCSQPRDVLRLSSFFLSPVRAHPATGVRVLLSLTFSSSRPARGPGYTSPFDFQYHSPC